MLSTKTSRITTANPWHAYHYSPCPRPWQTSLINPHTLPLSLKILPCIGLLSTAGWGWLQHEQLLAHSPPLPSPPRPLPWAVLSPGPGLLCLTERTGLHAGWVAETFSLVLWLSAQGHLRKGTALTDRAICA